MTSDVRLIQKVAAMGSRSAGIYPMYINTAYCNIEITATKWVIEEMEDGSKIPSLRTFGESIPTVTYTMKNMASIPIQIAGSVFSPYNVRAHAQIRDTPGRELREKLIKGHEAILVSYPEELKQRLQTEEITQGTYDEWLSDFNRVVPLVRKALVWKKAR